MKALTLHEPYATLIRLGLKRHETRSWYTGYRGPLAIHAGKSLASLNDLSGVLSRNASAQKIEAMLKPHGYSLLRPNEFPFGKILCVTTLVGCKKMTPSLIAAQSPQELAVGWWDVGRFALELNVTQVYDPPILASGAQGLWDWDAPQ